MNWDDGLVGNALEIAKTDDTPLRVLAGPGTGKTYALMRRVMRLLQSEVNPKRLLVCTFTRTAASDLKKELGILGAEGVENVRAGTLHAFCYGLMSKNEVLTFMGRTPRLLLDYEERFLLEDLHDNVFGGIKDCEKRLEAFNAAWARLQSEEPGWPTDPVDQAFHNRLQNWLHFHNAMLIGELVPETLRYLRENPECEERNAFDHVLVDEYQDLNRAEQTLLDLLAGDSSLTVIGDEDQSIYSFKHAHPEAISTFGDTHANTHDESLEECRRCPPLVVNLANALIANNSKRTPRNLIPKVSDNEGEVHVVQWPSTEAETRGIAKFIHHRIKEGIDVPGRILVLAPRRQFGYAIRDELKRLGTPAHSFFHEEALHGNPKELNESEAQQAFTLLSILENPEDRVALRCWCGFGSGTLRNPAWARIQAHCEQTGESPRATLEQMVAGTLKIANCQGIVERFAELNSRIRELEPLRGENLLNKLFPESEEWADQFRSIALRIDELDYEASTLREALRNGVIQPDLPTDVDYVRVMSLHKSKGLTADMVIVIGCIEGLIPRVKTHLNPLEKQKVIEENRRLFYVSITRTTRTLVLSSLVRLPAKDAYRIGAEVGGVKDGMARTIASRFLGELGPTRPATVRGTDFLKATGVE